MAKLPRDTNSQTQGESRKTADKTKIGKGEPSPIEVREIASSLSASAWQREHVRDTQRGQLWTRIACLRVYPVRDELPGPETWLIIREDEADNTRKINSPMQRKNPPSAV